MEPRDSHNLFMGKLINQQPNNNYNKDVNILQKIKREYGPIDYYKNNDNFNPTGFKSINSNQNLYYENNQNYGNQISDFVINKNNNYSEINISSQNFGNDFKEPIIQNEYQFVKREINPLNILSQEEANPNMYQEIQKIGVSKSIGPMTSENQPLNNNDNIILQNYMISKNNSVILGNSKPNIDNIFL